MPAPVEQQENTSSRFRFGLFEADAESGELRKSGIRIRLQAQPFRLLICLLERPAEVVTREEIQLQLWGNDTIVDFDHSLGTAINKLREALGDSAENPRFIETLCPPRLPIHRSRHRRRCAPRRKTHPPPCRRCPPC